MHQGRWLYLNIFKWGLVMGVVSLLPACVNLATTGAQAIYQHRSLQQNFSDSYLTLQIYQAIQDDKQLDDTNITVATYHADVLLTGQAPTHWQRIRIEKIAKDKAGINRVYNLIRIAAPLSTLKKMSDVWITTKIKAQFIASNDLDVSKIKVVTENGTVYLMGIVLKEEADAAVELASETDGVEKVIKLFSYLKVVKKV